MTEQQLLAKYENRYFELRREGHPHQSAVTELRAEDYREHQQMEDNPTGHDDAWWYSR